MGHQSGRRLHVGLHPRPGFKIGGLISGCRWSEDPFRLRIQRGETCRLKLWLGKWEILLLHTR